MGSRIPIFGLPHRISYYRDTETDDGYGGITVTPVVYKNTVRSRVTVMSDDDEREAFGESTGEHWRVVSIYFAGLMRSDKIKVSTTSKATPLDSTKYYRIIWFKPQIDEHGKFHHYSLLIELEKVDG